MKTIRRGRVLFHGMRQSLQYSNGWQICFDRIFRRQAKLACYTWRDRFYFVANPSAGDHLSLHEIFCRRIYDAHLGACAFPGNRVKYVNVGANIGGFDVKLRELGLSIGESLAVELNPRTLDRCRVNFQANNIPAKLVQAGVAGADGTVIFRPQRHSLEDNIFSRGDSGDGAGIPVRLVTLATLLREHAAENAEFDLLKLDCEGAEYAILRETPVALLRRFRYLIVEFHEEPPDESVARCYDRLREAGFVGDQRGPPRRPGPRDGAFTDLFRREPESAAGPVHSPIKKAPGDGPGARRLDCGKTGRGA
jgi:FkbM family methyltransferase